ncbi:hypothetical protein [Sporolactobacillus pectinivorans]|uniref:hypothetical protein n=1 Tax=Sporolactobacillus pectinivorans TaxID=1591408 RepID=UPI000C25FA13|nr:hypothetical protein [Sporolactobacillus pectinivorans]
MTNELLLKKVKCLLRMYDDGMLGGAIMPEDALIGVVPRDRLPDVLILGMSLNYQRSSYALWRSIADAYRDESSRWIFEPQSVADGDRHALKDILTHSKIVLQPNRHPDIWIRVSSGISNSSSTRKVMGLLESVEFDIAGLKTMVQITRKKEFPYLSGPKIFNYWLYVLEKYSGIKWRSRALTTVAPDTHVLQATVKLGLCPADVLNGREEERQRAAQAWKELLSGTGIAPIDVHTPLWLWSRAGSPPLICG